MWDEVQGALVAEVVQGWWGHAWKVGVCVGEVNEGGWFVFGSRGWEDEGGVE